LRNHCYNGKTVNIIYSEWVFVVSVIHHAKRMHCINLSSMAVLLYSVFLHYLMNGTIFRKKILNMNCVSGLSVQISLKHVLL